MSAVQMCAKIVCRIAKIRAILCINLSGTSYALYNGMMKLNIAIYVGIMAENGFLRVNVYRDGNRSYATTFKTWKRALRFFGTFLDTVDRIHVYAVGPENNP